MLRLTVLGSGSRGNALLLEGGDTRLLVDAGFGPRALSARLGVAGCPPEAVTALVLTHEHTDHASGAADATARWGWPIVASAGTWPALPVARAAEWPLLTPSAGTAIGAFDVQAIPVPHDASEPMALVVTHRASGCRAGIALDLGHVPEPLVAAFAGLDLLVVEANHDPQRLAAGPYPWMLKRRIGGGTGHLPNAAAAALAARCAHRGLRGVVLAHLSEVNNTPALALEAARTALRRAGWRRDAVVTASQGDVAGPVTAGRASAGRGRDADPCQLPLTLG